MATNESVPNAIAMAFSKSGLRLEFLRPTGDNNPLDDALLEGMRFPRARINGTLARRGSVRGRGTRPRGVLSTYQYFLGYLGTQHHFLAFKDKGNGAFIGSHFLHCKHGAGLETCSVKELE